MHRTIARTRTALALAIASLFGTSFAEAATITVTTAGDMGTPSTCTLRQALVAANTDSGAGSACTAGSGADIVVFAPALGNSTITLARGELAINDAVTVQGSGQTIDAAAASGALYVTWPASHTHPTVAISNVTFTNGYAVGAARAGGVTARYADLTLSNVTVSANASKDSPAGGVLVSYSNVTLDHAVVSTNFSRSSSPTAGGIALPNGSSLNLTHTSVSGNQAAASGRYSSGALYVGGGGQLNMLDSTIANNSATGYTSKLAGALMLRDGVVIAANSTIANNSTSGINNLAGGILSTFAVGSAQLTNCTISGNVASGSDTPTTGGILASVGSATFTLSNSILSGNAGFYKDAYAVDAASLSAQSSLLGTALQASIGGASNVFSDAPGLSALAGNGGTTLTMALAPTSPALRSGSTALAVWNGVPLRFDQRGTGFLRQFSNAVDIGAFQDPGDRIFGGVFDAEP